MKKKWKWITAIIALLLSLQACGSKPDKATEPDTAQPITVQAGPAETASAERDAAFYCGTWTVSGVHVNGVDFTFEQVAAMSEGEAEQVYIVLVSDGTAYLVEGSYIDSSDWSVTNEGIQINVNKIPFENERLIIDTGDGLMYFEKTSDEQTVPENTESIETPIEEQGTGIRPEFKEAMDSYEAFYDEYCDLLAQYTKNPTDLSLLNKYSSMLSKAEEMDKKFEAWDEGKMSNEELKYYLDVSTRIQKKLVDLF